MSEDITSDGTPQFCPSCREQQIVVGMFCSNCGRLLNGASVATTRRVPPWALVAIAAVIALFASTIVFLSVDSGDAAAVDELPAPFTTTIPVTTTEATTTTQATLDLDDVELAETYGGAVFKISTVGCGFEGTGSGFAIDARHIVTNRHVVRTDTTPTIYARDGGRFTGRVIGWDEDPDIAIIQVDRDLPTYLTWADSDELAEGQRTVSLGYPLPEFDFSVAPGVVLSFDVEGSHRAAIRSDAQLDRGNSGGPTLLADGRVAGVVTQMDLNYDGFQFVPIILPANDMSERAEWMIDHPARPSVDCDAVQEAYEQALPATTTTTVAPAVPHPATSFYTVILASMQKRSASYDQAMRRAQELADVIGATTYVLDSNNYPSLTPGLWVVYIGSMNRQDAKDYAEYLRRYGIDSFAKQVSG